MDSTNNTINKIPKTLKRYKTVNDLPLTSTMQARIEINNKNSFINEAKVIKLKTLSNKNYVDIFSQNEPVTTSTPTITTTASIRKVINTSNINNDSFTSVSSIDDNNNNKKLTYTTITKTSPAKANYGLVKLYIVRDFNGSLIYGDLDVKQGEFVYLLCKSESYYFVENQNGKYGFIPGEICVDLDEVCNNAQFKQKQQYHQHTTKITSF